jgi:hypothetical protein
MERDLLSSRPKLRYTQTIPDLLSRPTAWQPARRHTCQLDHLKPNTIKIGIKESAYYVWKIILSNMEIKGYLLYITFVIIALSTKITINQNRFGKHIHWNIWKMKYIQQLTDWNFVVVALIFTSISQGEQKLQESALFWAQWLKLHEDYTFRSFKIAELEDFRTIISWVNSKVLCGKLSF